MISKVTLSIPETEMIKPEIEKLHSLTSEIKDVMNRIDNMRFAVEAKINQPPEKSSD